MHAVFFELDIFQPPVPHLLPVCVVSLLIFCFDSIFISLLNLRTWTKIFFFQNSFYNPYMCTLLQGVNAFHLPLQIPTRPCDSAWAPRQLGQSLELSPPSASTTIAHDFSVDLPKDRYSVQCTETHRPQSQAC